ncbi:MAG TPA: ABC transporter substrate-binding protein [Stellaceae bacterium]|jgi:NitT/TauT family transport system substrate-binding protein
MIARFLLAAALLALTWRPASAETVRSGYLKAAPAAPIFIAKEKGYYAAEGLDVELTTFEAAEPVAVAVASGSLDISLAGMTAGFYSLAGQGALKIIAGAIHEVPGFQSEVVVASNRAYDAGMRSLKDLDNRSMAVTQVGSALHYSLGLIAEKYALDLKTIRVVPTQSNPNSVAAVAGGQVDGGLAPVTYFTPLLQRGGAKVLGFIGDETPWQLGVIITSTKMASEHPDTVQRWLRAFRKAARDYHDAFTGPDGKRADQASAPEILAIMAKYIGQTPDQLRAAIGYVDRDARLDVKDIEHQVAWFKSQGLLKDNVDADAIIDRRYIEPLPTEAAH